MAVVLIPSDIEGMERRPFWSSPVLVAAESDEVILRDVAVPRELIFYTGERGTLDPVQISGFLWFELLISASYLGMATALVERAVAARRGEAVERALLGSEVEGAMAALEGVAYAMMSGHRGQHELARALFVRYAVQRAVERAAAHAVELLGGMAFITSADVAYLFAACHALTFHPPSRSSIAAALAAHLTGEQLVIQ
jgi:alkylation response protein AidB-like acyl-CoA dehydrogenase